MIDVDERPATGRYTWGQLAGREPPRHADADPLLWRWGEAVAGGELPRLSADQRDSLEALGMRPVLGKSWRSSPPCDIDLLSVDLAFDALWRRDPVPCRPIRRDAATLPRAMLRRVGAARLNREQACLFLYYAAGLGARLWHNHTDESIEAYERELARRGLDSGTGDLAVGRRLGLSTWQAREARKRGIGWLLEYLNGEWLP